MNQHTSNILLCVVTVAITHVISSTASFTPISTVERDLVARARLTVDQSCYGSIQCSSVNLTTCVVDGVCTPTKVCNGREHSLNTESPVDSWSPVTEQEGCKVVSGFPRPAVSAGTTAIRVYHKTLVVNATNGLSSCFVEKNSTVDDVFTVIFWLEAHCTNCTVLELIQPSSPPLQLRVMGKSLCIGSECQQIVRLGEKRRVLVSVRVIQGELSVFTDDDRFNISEASLDVENIYLGSSEIPPEGDYFYMYDNRYYSGALTFSEIEHLQSGFPSMVSNFPECQCTSYFPDTSSEDDDLCTNGTDTVSRFEEIDQMNSLHALQDKDALTKWASSQYEKVFLNLTFGLSYEIDSIKLSFDTHVPSEVACTFFSNGFKMGQTRTMVMTNNGNQFELDFGILNSSISYAGYEEHIADTINLEMQRTDSLNKSFILSGIDVIGKCDCRGNADQCDMNLSSDPNSYKCTCSQDSHTKGKSCVTCGDGFFRAEDDFGCPNSCQCNLDGVKHPSDICDNTGKCICKDLVLGTQCDTCQEWTYNLTDANPEGCSECQCLKEGAFGCSNLTGECICRPHVASPSCDQCEAGHYDLGSGESGGCQSCGCNALGSVGGQGAECNSTTGQCMCKENVEGTKCDYCKPGFYNLDPSHVMGCIPCGCNPVGSSDMSCNLNTGQCVCRVASNNTLKCSPQVTSVMPSYGPESGGTLVTVTGSLLGDASYRPSLFVGSAEQLLVSSSDELIVFKTLPATSQTGSLKLDWQTFGAPELILSSSFSYKLDPIVFFHRRNTEAFSTFVSGGCLIELNGINLASVKNPKLMIQRDGDNSSSEVETCRHFDSTSVVCYTPNTKSLVASGGVGQGFEMVAVFDGLQFPGNRSIEVVEDPAFNDMGTVEFQYPFESTIILTGRGLKSGCRGNQYTVLLGVVSCRIERVSDSEIECSPPRSAPNDQRTHRIKISIGNVEKEVGIFEYLDFWETTGFIIIITSIAALSIAVVSIIIICCCCRYRAVHTSNKPFCFCCKQCKRSKKPSKYDTFSHKNGTNVNAQQMNEYTELPPMTPTANGQNGFSNIAVEIVPKEPKRGVVNTSAEDAVLVEEFLPLVEPGLQDDITACSVGRGHFSLGRRPTLKGKNSFLCAGSLQKNGVSVMKLTIKSLSEPSNGGSFPSWASQALGECLRLRRYNHPHVLSIFGVGIDQRRFHILYPLMAQGTLKGLVAETGKDFSVRQLLGFSQQVASGVQYLHSKDITHKDVAARNCLVDEVSVVKISDAAFSWDMYPEDYVYDAQRERHLPLRWMAPESITGGYYDQRTDVWSFAVLVWELLTRCCLPFHEVTEAQDVRDYILQGYILGQPEALSDPVYELLRTCWSPENSARPGMGLVSRKLGEMLEHEEEGAATSHGNQHYSTTNLSRV